MKTSVGIIGGAGYTAGELLRILLYHPSAAVAWAHSQSHAGQPLHSVHKDLWGETSLCFTEKYDFEAVECIFLCMGHGQSKVFLAQNALPAHVKVIDLSQDFRLQQEGFVYGLPEKYRAQIQTARYIANPGCFATAIQLALLPLAEAGILQNDVHINAITGSTGAGQQPTAETHFSWRNNNVSVYKPFAHQHEAEIKMHLQLSTDMHFLPVRGNFTRGILATAYTDTGLHETALRNLYENYYAGEPFAHFVAENPDLKRVVGTNKAVISASQHGKQSLIVCAIDNLLKGASGQAVQNFNLLFGYEEKAGLQLKSIAF